MNEDNIDLNQIDLGKLLSSAYQMYKRAFPTFIGIALICAIINECAVFILNIAGTDNLSIAFLINIFVTSWASIVIIDISSQYVLDKPVSFKETFKKAREKYWLFVAVTSSTIVAFGLGLLMLILPGLIVATLFVLADILVVHEKVGFFEAFKKSIEYVKPHFIKVFIYLMFILGISSIPGMIVQINSGNLTQFLISISKVASVIIMPFFIISQVMLYFRLKEISTDEI